MEKHDPQRRTWGLKSSNDLRKKTKSFRDVSMKRLIICEKKCVLFIILRMSFSSEREVVAECQSRMVFDREFGAPKNSEAAFDLVFFCHIWISSSGDEWKDIFPYQINNVLNCCFFKKKGSSSVIATLSQVTFVSANFLWTTRSIAKIIFRSVTRKTTIDFMQMSYIKIFPNFNRINVHYSQK